MQDWVILDPILDPILDLVLPILDLVLASPGAVSGLGQSHFQD